MSYIQPDGLVTLYKNVPLLPNYRDTVYFEYPLEQYAWFQHYQWKVYNDISYQRVGRNYIRLEGNAEDFYNVNYMSFKNRAFGDKTFYAFILSCEYKNNNCVELHYKIDVMQTWALDYVLSPCMVEREHSSDDYRYSNQVEEPTGTNDYHLQRRVGAGLTEYWLVLCYAPVSNIDVPPEQLLSGIYNPLYYYTQPYTEAGCDAMNALLFEAAFFNWQEHVISMYSFPRLLFDYVDQSGIPPTKLISNQYPKRVDSPLLSEPETFKYVSKSGSYRPKNNKLYSFPYQYVRVDTTINIEDYQYENFNALRNGEENFIFSIWGFIAANPKIVIVPYGYEGVDIDVSKLMVETSFPQLPILSQTFINWLGSGGVVSSLFNVGNIISKKQEMNNLFNTQNNESESTSRRETKTTTITEGKTREKLTITESTGGTSGTSKRNTEKEVNVGAELKREAIALAGHSGLGSTFSFTKGDSGDALGAITLQVGNDRQSVRDIYFEHMAISGEQAEVIDEFFSYYGYATSRIKIPNRHARQKWTYVKTNGCKLRGNVNASDLQEIADVFDSGITFWDFRATFGQYVDANGDILYNAPLHNQPWPGPTPEPSPI